MSERCLFCGGEIPEGRQFCKTCENKFDRVISAHASTGMTWAETEGRIEAVTKVISELSSSTGYPFIEALAHVEASAMEALQMQALGGDPAFRKLLFHKIEDNILYGEIANIGKKKCPMRALLERFGQLIDRLRRNHEKA